MEVTGSRAGFSAHARRLTASATVAADFSRHLSGVGGCPSPSSLSGRRNRVRPGVKPNGSSNRRTGRGAAAVFERLRDDGCLQPSRRAAAGKKGRRRTISFLPLVFPSGGRGREDARQMLSSKLAANRQRVAANHRPGKPICLMAIALPNYQTLQTARHRMQRAGPSCPWPPRRTARSLRM
jgi:hypothetical protein